MSQHVVHASRTTTAPIDVVWHLVATASMWPSWTRIPLATLEREGSPVPDGVGAIRNLGTRALSSREEVVAFEPPTHLGYVLLSGLPVVDYRSDVTLTARADGGTDIEWHSTFTTPKAATAWFWRRFLATTIKGFARQLAKGSTKAAARR